MTEGAASDIQIINMAEKRYAVSRYGDVMASWPENEVTQSGRMCMWVPVSPCENVHLGS